MKINVYQKVILVLYILAFSYFSIMHVPFKIKQSQEIKYDTLFSTLPSLDISRLLLIIVSISILTSVLFLLLQNISTPYKLYTLSPKARKVVIAIIGLLVILISVYGYSRYQIKKIDSESFKLKINSTILDSSKIADSIKAGPDSPITSSLKAENCTNANAIENFRDYMKFYYPDWKIYGKPIIKEQSNCKYEIQFTTMNPHIRYEKEVIIVELSFNSFNNYNSYYFTIVRGNLY